MRLALTIEYEGTRYHGFQSQASAPTIQGELERAIRHLTGERIRVQAAGRTDAGVHALAQVIAFDTAAAHPPHTFIRALNHWLPHDIAVKNAHVAPADFDPRRHARRRAYRYRILNAPTRSPLARRFACHIPQPLDVPHMQAAAVLFLGEHDFSRFAPPLPPGKSPVRAVFSASVRQTREQSGAEIIFDVAANAFLRRQVRRMAGALADIGLGKLTIPDLQTLIANPADADAIKPARALPPQGLCLVSVQYDNFTP